MNWLLNLPAWVALPLPVVPLAVYIVGLSVRFAWEGRRLDRSASPGDGRRHARETIGCRGARR